MAQGIFVERAEPDDPFLDVFCCGQTRFDQYFRTREWFAEQSKGGSLTTYVFRAGEAGPVVGYAAVSFRNQPHPDDASDLSIPAHGRYWPTQRCLDHLPLSRSAGHEQQDNQQLCSKEQVDLGLGRGGDCASLL
jgi:hypothetical protein